MCDGVNRSYLLANHTVSMELLGMETPIRHVRMPDELWNALERIGKEPEVDRTPGWLVRKAIEEFIERHRAAKRQAKQEAQ